MVDCWIIFPGEAAQAPSAVKLLGTELVGQIYVDHAKGFLLRVECEISSRDARPFAVVHDLTSLEWDIPYAEIKTLPLRQLTSAECKALGLPARPRALWRHCDSRLAHCRKLIALDPMRESGHPDIVKAWVRIGRSPRGEQILVRLEEEAFPSVYECTVFSAPQHENSFTVGERVIVVGLAWQGEDSLYCVWSTDAPLVPRDRHLRSL